MQETGHAVQVSDSSVQASPWNPACLPMATCLFLKFKPFDPPLESSDSYFRYNPNKLVVFLVV